MNTLVSSSASYEAGEHLNAMEDLPHIDMGDEYEGDLEDDQDADDEVVLLKEQLALVQKQFKQLQGKVKFVDKVHNVQTLELKHKNLQLTKDVMERDENLKEKDRQISELREVIRDLQGQYPSEEQVQEELRDRQAMMREIKRLEEENQRQLEEKDQLEQSNLDLMQELEKAYQKKNRQAESDTVLDENHKRVLDENKRLRNKMVQLSMSETNLQFRLTTIEDEYEAVKQHLEDTQIRIKTLESWLDEVFQNEDYRVVSIESLAVAEGLSLAEAMNESTKFGQISTSSPFNTPRLSKDSKNILPAISENNLTPRARIETDKKNGYQNKLLRNMKNTVSAQHPVAIEHVTNTVKAEMVNIDKTLENISKSKPLISPRQRGSRRSGGYRDKMVSGRKANLPTIEETDAAEVFLKEKRVDMALSIAKIKNKALTRRNSSSPDGSKFFANPLAQNSPRKHRSPENIESNDNYKKGNGTNLGTVNKNTPDPRKHRSPENIESNDNHKKDNGTNLVTVNKNKPGNKQKMNKATFLSSIRITATDDSDIDTEKEDNEASKSTGTTPPPSPKRSDRSPDRTQSEVARETSVSRSQSARVGSRASSASVHSVRGRSAGPTTVPNPMKSRTRSASSFHAEAEQEDEDMTPIPEYEGDGLDDDDSLNNSSRMSRRSAGAESVKSQRSTESRNSSPQKAPNKSNIPKAVYSSREMGYRDRYSRTKSH